MSVIEYVLFRFVVCISAFYFPCLGRVILSGEGRTDWGRVVLSRGSYFMNVAFMAIFLYTVELQWLEQAGSGNSFGSKVVPAIQG